MKPIESVRAMLKELVGGPDTPFMARRVQAEAFAAAFAIPGDIAIEASELGGVPVEWISPGPSVAPPAFLHLHGGGYVLGNPAGSRPFTTALARLLAASVVSVDYRLAPEHPFPAAVDDALAAYAALLNQGVPATAIAVGGESAGGGLALALVVAARDAGLPLPSAIVAISPWTDMLCNAPSFAAKAATDPLLTARSLKEMGDAYLGDSDPRHPLASPLFANLASLPPTLIHVGSEEVLLDDSLRFAEAARRQGVEAEAEIWPEMIHVWHMFHPVLPESMAAIENLAAFVRGHWKA